ncbi:glycosyl hydrolase catalytic core-domain-containing protein [Dendryphion nanum]|uniref:Glycosyl hydrolase catalytic core-domain-containing protein n=1 Tax=Dendryphion nanum TaxID=256645 RepID=A0A9P9CZ79_9PLEO|nr:glycosyl hydrolase catalytic core-domain-containing protein [Dendryphion nanum]
MMDSHTSICHKALLLLALLPPTLSQSDYPNRNTKRGIAYMGTHANDNALLLSRNTPLSWYYNWSPYPPTSQIPQNSPLEFVPLIHGLDGARSSRTSEVINSLPSSSQHILSFNEPDGTTDSGGSSIKPEDAARAYIDHIVPYRNGNGRKWKISHPSTTGSPMGLEWLRKFNESCYKIDSTNGCPTDFIAAHWYGAFDGLAAWLGTLDEFYNTNTSQDLKIWVTEWALPQADTRATVAMMNQSLPYLDRLDYVERYSWFGAFRTDDANEWTGDGVALFDDDGGLTELGALYMGGNANGFSKGQKGNGGESAAMSLGVHGGLLFGLCLFAVMISNLV